MWMLLVPAAFAALFLVAFGLVAFFNPTYISEEEIETKDSTGALIKVKYPKVKTHNLGMIFEFGGIVLLPILAICIFVLVVPSDRLVQTRLTAWKLFWVTNPDGAHAVLDAPDDLMVTAGTGTVTFKIPEGIDPLWIIVTATNDTDTLDSLVLPLSSKKSDGTVSFTHKKIKEATRLKAMYGTATGPSAEVEIMTP